MINRLREGPVADESIPALLSRVVADAEHVARAEIELQKVKLAAKLADAQKAAVFGIAALVTGSLALTALVVGALMILTPLVGPLWATVIVMGVLLAATALLGWLAAQEVKLLFGASKGKA